MPSGQWYVVESYAGFSDDPAALGAIVTLLTEWRAPGARPYLADAGLVWVERCPDVSADAPPPPRDAEWLDVPSGERSWTRTLDAEEVRALAPDVLPLQGRAYADASGALVVHWIPWLPDRGEGPEATRRPR